MPKKVNKGGGGFDSAFSEAVVKHRSDETTYSASGELPPGIEAGIAKLSMAKIGEFQKGDFKGEKFFMAQGVVVSPVEHEGQRIQGLRTNIGPEPLCDTPERESRPTLDDHVAWVLNHLRMLGGDDCVAEVESLEDLEEVLEALVESDIYFRFRTWRGEPSKQYPNPKVNHEWKGATEYDEDNAEEDVEDDTEEEEEEDEKPKKKGKVVPKGKSAKSTPTTAKASSKPISKKGGKETKPTKKKEEEEVPFGDDLDMLADAAEEDAEAANRLTELAVEAGLEEDWVENAPSWADVAEAIREAQGGEDSEEEEEEEEEEEDGETQPEKGETYAYKPKGKKKAVEVEVTAVFEGKQTCNCKDEDGTVYKAVPWSALEAL